jgi:hypothetical protein
VRIAMQNPKWGYTRIQGGLANPRHTVARGTVANVLKANGIELAALPRRVQPSGIGNRANPT